MILIKNFTKKNQKLFFLIILFTLLVTMSAVPIPYFTKYLIDNVLIEGKYHEMWFFILIISIIIFFQLVLGRVNVKISARFFQKFLYQLRYKLFEMNFQNYFVKSDNINTIIFNDTELYTNSIQMVFTTLLNNILTLICYIFLMATLNWKLTIITISFVPIYIFWIVYVSNKLKQLSGKQQENKDNLLKAIKNTSDNIEVIYIYNFIGKIINFFDQIIDRNKNLNTVISEYQNFINIVSGIIITTASIIPFIFGMKLVEKQIISIGSLIAFNSYSGLVFGPITQLISIISTVQISSVYNERIMSILNNSEKNFVESNELLIHELVIKNLNIYSKGKAIIKGINLTLEMGNFIYLSGNNGCGKTLLLKSIANLYGDISGKIDYIVNDNGNNRPVEFDSVKSQKVIYVSNQQKFVLTNLYEEFTIENEISNLEIDFCLEITDSKQKIDSLSKGIYTDTYFINENFSTGEIQKLRIARALARKPSILLLDEIFANIDKQKSSNILSNIKKHFPNLLLIVVEHHIVEKTLFERGLYIEKGKVLELYTNKI